MIKIIKQFIWRAMLIVFQLSLLAFIVYRVVPVPYTPLMLQRSLETTNESFKLQKKWIKIENMSPNMPLLAVTGEDPQFFNHIGFDFEQIKNAIEKKIEKGKTLRGASTISQQTVKNIFLLPIRSFIRKAIEVPLTLMMEAMWNKKRILEVYLNIIEMGDGIFGVEAASNFYYHKSSSNLSVYECAAIVTTFPSPLKRNPTKLAYSLKKHQIKLVNLRKYIDKKNFWWYK
jgi:monofunctional biosynthetic peptidoglycan transglycosylase